MPFPPWINKAGNTAQGSGPQQKLSTEPAIDDLYKSSGVFINQIEVVLYDNPNPGENAKTAFLISIDGDGVTDDNQADTLGPLNQTLADGISNGTISSGDIANTTAPTTVASVTVINSGTNVVDTTVTFSGGNPATPATATLVITDGHVTSVTLTNPGEGYTSVPTVTAGDSGVQLIAVLTPTPAPPVKPPTTNNSYESVSSSSQDFTKYDSEPIPYATLMLTPKTSLATFTTKASLWGRGDKKEIIAQKGLKVSQILTNLADLATNIWEPLIAKYPGLKITNTFRQDPPGGSMNQQQHGTGQAFDAQLPGASYEKYYEICCWMRDTLPIGQLLQERCGTSSDRTWIHCSYENKKYGIVVPKQNKCANLDLTLSTGQFSQRGLYQYA